MALIVKPPQPIPFGSDKVMVFLGGSIEMGKAEDWQTALSDLLSDLDIIILNPRRDDWDSSWAQDPTPGTPFHGQVTWERDGQNVAHIKAYYFADNTQSPITLLELGEYGANWSAFEHEPDCIVRVTPGFYRYGNVMIFCVDNDVPVVDTVEQMAAAIRGMVERFWT